MSGTEDRNDELTPDSNAFEFVLGTMRGQARKRFEKELRTNTELQAAVQFWEEKLMPMRTDEQRSPAPDTWDKISRRIKQGDETHLKARESKFSLFNFWQWAAPTVAAVGLMLVLFGYYPNTPLNSPNTDYVAVLTSENGEPILTAITAAQGKQMWLKWETTLADKDSAIQLWAKSKRDGQVRPISVFENSSATSLTLTPATWRLITDAESLIITEEEPGGSAIDEPSDIVIAKGVCVRFSQPRESDLS